jgi:hypothetical protein
MDSFWAEARPRVRNTFNVHYFGPPDRPGTIDHFMIVKDKRVHALGHWMGQPYMVFITNDHGTLWNTSTAPLLIVANRIDIGTELAGSPSTSSDAASVDRTDFTRNLWAVKPLDNAYVFWYRAQSKAGEIRSDNQSLNLDWTPSTRVRLLMMADRSGSPNRAYNCIQVGPTP